MKNILVLGAGLVSKPGVRYLLSQPEFNITVASRTIEKAQAIVKGFSNGSAILLNVKNTEILIELIHKNDIVISLLPWTHHVKIAELCLSQNTHMATTSYVSEDMKALDSEVKKRNLIFLNAPELIRIVKIRK